MKNKYFFLLLMLVPVILYFGYSYWSKAQKDKWFQEAPALRYSDERENEVWGGNLRGDDPSLFYGTPLYDLADAMSGFLFFKNQYKIERLIRELPAEYVNYQEEKYGMTIGHFALNARNLKAIRLLLDKGLNPNLENKRGVAIIAEITSTLDLPSVDTVKTLQYMIKKNIDFNRNSKQSYTYALVEAARYNLEHVKVLVKAGANAHFLKNAYSDNRGYSDYFSPLISALMFKQIDIVNYLIFEQKVDFRKLKNPHWSKFYPGEYRILHDLRDMPFELNTKMYQEKMKLVAYLNTQGLDYWKTSIPDYIRTNPHYGNKEYLSKY